MRVCICGLHRDSVVKKNEEKFGVESINVDFPGMEDNDYKLFHYAAETFKYFNKKNIVFDGGIFDNFKFYADLGWSELQEQVIMSAIFNLDEIIIITEGMSDKNIEFCNYYAGLYPDKIKLISNENEYIG